MTRREFDALTRVNYYGGLGLYRPKGDKQWGDGQGMGNRTAYRRERGKCVGEDYLASRASVMARRRLADGAGARPTLAMGSIFRVWADIRRAQGRPLLG